MWSPLFAQVTLIPCSFKFSNKKQTCVFLLYFQIDDMSMNEHYIFPDNQWWRLWQSCQQSVESVSWSFSVSICGRVGASWRGRAVMNLTQAGARRPLTGLSERRAAAASTWANGLIITADSAFDDKDRTTDRGGASGLKYWNAGGFKRMWKGRNSDFSYTSMCLIKSRLPQQTRRSRVNYSFHFCSFHRRQFFFPRVTLGVFTRDSAPASRNKPGFDAFSPLLFSVSSLWLQIVTVGVWSAVKADEQMWPEFSGFKVRHCNQNELHTDWGVLHVTDDATSTPFN